MHVPFVDLKSQYHSIKPEIDNVLQDVCEKSCFTLGPYVERFEKEFASLHQSKFCKGLNSGTSALHVALMALNIGYGDEVILPTNTFMATAATVALTGAIPVFVDCEDRYFNMDPSKIVEKIGAKTKAVIVVHLYGQPADMKEIQKISKSHNIYLIEDCAQAHLSSYNSKSVGSFGICGCFSFYPGKNLGAYGEAGAIITNDSGMDKKVSMLRDHGSSKKYHHELIGHNYRMEGFQGAVLSVKLKYLNQWTRSRQKIADLYESLLKDISEIKLPQKRRESTHVYHLFVIRVKNRGHLIDFLKKQTIDSGIHYPIPCHLQPAFEHLGYQKGDFPVAEEIADEIVSLPIFPELKEEQVTFVSDCLHNFYKC